MSKSLKEVLDEYPVVIARDIPAVLDKVGDRIASGAWCQGPTAINSDGQSVSTFSKEAVGWCYTGHIEKALYVDSPDMAPIHRQMLWDATLHASDTQLPKTWDNPRMIGTGAYQSINYNDDKGHTTKDDVVALARRTAAAVRELLPA